MHVTGSGKHHSRIVDIDTRWTRLWRLVRGASGEGHGPNVGVPERTTEFVLRVKLLTLSGARRDFTWLLTQFLLLAVVWTQLVVTPGVMWECAARITRIAVGRRRCLDVVTLVT